MPLSKHIGLVTLPTLHSLRTAVSVDLPAGKIGKNLFWSALRERHAVLVFLFSVAMACCPVSESLRSTLTSVLQCVE